MKTKSEIQSEIEKVYKDIGDIKQYLEEDDVFAVDRDMLIEDLVYLDKKVRLLKWILE